MLYIVVVIRHKLYDNGEIADTQIVMDIGRGIERFINGCDDEDDRF